MMSHSFRFSMTPMVHDPLLSLLYVCCLSKSVTNIVAGVIVHDDVGTSMFESVGILAFMDTDDRRMIEFSQQTCLSKYLGHVAFHRRIMQGLDHHFFIKIEIVAQKGGSKPTRSQDLFRLIPLHGKRSK